MMVPSRKHFSLLLLGFGALLALVASAIAMDQVGREQDIVNLRLGQRVRVDDGSCAAGLIKEVSGAKMTPTGVLATRTCVSRLGPKKK